MHWVWLAIGNSGLLTFLSTLIDLVANWLQKYNLTFRSEFRFGARNFRFLLNLIFLHVSLHSIKFAVKIVVDDSFHFLGCLDFACLDTLDTLIVFFWKMKSFICKSWFVHDYIFGMLRELFLSHKLYWTWRSQLLSSASYPIRIAF